MRKVDPVDALIGLSVYCFKLREYDEVERQSIPISQAILGYVR